jgi:hypothetical protein
MDFKRSMCKESTMHYLKTSVYDYLVKCPYQSTGDALEIRQWLLKNTTNSIAKRILTYLNASTEWGIKHGLANCKTSAFKGMSEELPKHNWELTHSLTHLLKRKKRQL